MQLDESQGLEQAHIKIGKILGSYPSLTDHTVATVEETGAISFFSKWKVFDYELNDFNTVRYGFDVDYFFDQNPSIIVMAFNDNIFPGLKEKLSEKDFREYIINLQQSENRKIILENERFSNFELVGIYRFNEKFYQFVFSDVDFAQNNVKLINELTENSLIL